MIQDSILNKELYAYVNIDTNPLIAWEVAIGRIRSACDTNLFNNDFGISMWMYSKLKQFTANIQDPRIHNEFLLESVRQKFFSHQVSRLRGVYFFDSEDILRDAVIRWNMKFNPEYVTKVFFSASKLSYVDSEWITNNLNKNKKSSEWMISYWNGEIYGEVALTEILASGIGYIANKKLRESAYKKIVKLFPRSEMLLYSAVCAFAYGKQEDILQMIHGAIKNNNEICIRTYIDFGSFNKNQDSVIAAIEEARKANFFPIGNKITEEVNLPDLTSYDFKITQSKIVDLYQEINNHLIHLS